MAKENNFASRADLMIKLKELEINEVTVSHPEVFTVEQMMPYVRDQPCAAITKNLFLRDKKKGLWLLSARHDAVVNLAELAKKVGASGGFRLADEKVLQDTLGVRQGCVTAFALMNDTDNKVKFMIDSRLIDSGYERVYFHPLENTATTGISPANLLRFLEAIGHVHIPVDLDS